MEDFRLKKKSKWLKRITGHFNIIYLLIYRNKFGLYFENFIVRFCYYCSSYLLFECLAIFNIKKCRYKRRLNDVALLRLSIQATCARGKERQLGLCSVLYSFVVLYFSDFMVKEPYLNSQWSEPYQKCWEKIH